MFFCRYYAGIYDYVFYLLQGPSKTAEIQSSFWATIITLIIFAGYSIFLFVIKKEDNPEKTAQSKDKKTEAETEKKD